MEPDLWEVLRSFGPKLLFAVLCGGAIGLERELKHKPAGIKTNILICVGATLYTSVSVMISRVSAEAGAWGDPARVAAQIVSGIGFLGGGAILQARGTVLGLTTAATIWVVAAIGIAIGIGREDVAFFTALSVIVVLVASNFIEARMLGRVSNYASQLVLSDPKGEVRQAIHHALAENDLELQEFEISARGELTVLTCRYSGANLDHKKFLLELWSLPGVREIKQL